VHAFDRPFQLVDSRAPVAPNAPASTRRAAHAQVQPPALRCRAQRSRKPASREQEAYDPDSLLAVRGWTW